MAAVAGGALALFLAILVGLVVAGLPVGGAAYLGLAVTSVLAVFVGVGALTSQLAATRRIATELGVGVFGACFVAASGRRHVERPGVVAMGDAARLG